MDELNPTFRFKISERLVEQGLGKYIHRTRQEDGWCLRFANHDDRDEAEITLEELEQNLVRARKEARVSRDRLRALEALHFWFVTDPQRQGKKPHGDLDLVQCSEV